MNDRKLKRAPQYVNHAEDWWFYEEPRGLCVVVEQYDDALERRLGTRQVTIPWARVRAALKRKDKP